MATYYMRKYCPCCKHYYYYTGPTIDATGCCPECEDAGELAVVVEVDET